VAAKGNKKKTRLDAVKLLHPKPTRGKRQLVGQIGEITVEELGHWSVRTRLSADGAVVFRASADLTVCIPLECRSGLPYCLDRFFPHHKSFLRTCVRKFRPQLHLSYRRWPPISQPRAEAFSPPDTIRVLRPANKVRITRDSLLQCVLLVVNATTRSDYRCSNWRRRASRGWTNFSSSRVWTALRYPSTVSAM